MNIFFVIDDLYGSLDRTGIGILSALAKQDGHKTKLIVRTYHQNNILNIIDKEKPDIIAYSLATGEHNGILKLHRKIKKHYECEFIFGGTHPTYYPEFINEEGVEVICIGEAEIAFREYLKCIGAGQDITKVPNLHIKTKTGIIKNTPAPLIEDLNSLPFQDRQFFAEVVPEIYKFHIMVSASRGCPFSCTYCANHSFVKLYGNSGKKTRFRSVESVINEVKSIDCKGVQMIHFHDDNFLYKPKSWVEEFASRWKNEINIPFGIIASADKIKDNVIVMLKQAGLRSVCYAIESGDEDLNKELLNRAIDFDVIEKATAMLKRHGIYSILQSMTLFPVEDPFKVDIKTLQINQKLKPSVAVSTPLTPYPGTEILKYATEKGYIDMSEVCGIPKINKEITVLHFNNQSSCKKSLIIHYFFDLMVQFPILTHLYKLHFLMPMCFLRFFYNIYELRFAYKRFIVYCGIKLNYENVSILFKQYLRYKKNK